MALFNEQEQDLIRKAVEEAEKNTSGEVTGMRGKDLQR